MAVVSTLTNVAVKMNLNNGTDSEGNVKTVAVALGSLDTTGYDAQKAMNCINAISACLTKTVYTVSEVKTSTLKESA